MLALIHALIMASQTPAANTVAIDTARIAEAVRAEMQRTRAPGVALGVIVDGRVVFARGYGSTSAERTDPVGTGTLFRIGSVTKVLTGLAALGSVHNQRVSLQQPISAYLPGLHPRLARLTLEQLLTHRAGLIALPSAHGPSDEEALQRRVLEWTDSVLFAEPGEAYSYSSPGYWLAGAVIEHAERTRYAELVRRHVFEPLGMSTSTFDPLVAFTHASALDHRRDPQGKAMVVRPYPNDASTWPGGSAFSSINDLNRLASALLNHGRIGEQLALPASTAAAVMTRHTDNPAGPCGYTFGLGICAAGADTITSHYGFRSGSGAVFTLVPTKRAAVIILANIGGAIFFQTERAILDMLGVVRENNPPPTLRDIAQNDFARFAGKYAAGSDTIHIFEQNSKLVLKAFLPEPQPLRIGGANELFIVDAEGRPAARFVLLRSEKGNWFLSDGLNSFRRTAASPGRSSGN